MKDVPRQTLVYTVILVAGTTAAFMVAYLRADRPWPQHDLLVALILFVMIFLAELLDVNFPRSVMTFNVSVSAAFAFAAGLTITPFLGGLVVAIAHLVDGIRARRQPIRTVVNAGVHSLCTLAAAAVYLSLATVNESPLSSYRNVAVLILAAAVFTLINGIVLALIVSPVVGVSPLEMWRANLVTGSSVELLTLVTLGSLIPVLGREAPFAIALLIVPLLIGPHLVLRGLRKAQVETRTTMESLADALERRDPYTHQHSVRVTDTVRGILDEMPQLSRQEVDIIIGAARVHDLGKVGTRDAALNKPGALSAEERREMERHVTIGADIVGQLEEYRSRADIIRHHHERWDGTGYPNGLRGEEIPLGSRIIAVSDAFDAMTSDRVYRRALPTDVALAELRKGCGVQFDPRIVELFESVVLRRSQLGSFQPGSAADGHIRTPATPDPSLTQVAARQT